MTVSTEHIAKTPGVCGGKPCIAGHRIRVHDVVIWHLEQGKSVEQIVRDFPQLAPADVYAALTYYHDHREEIDVIMREEREFYEEGKAKQPSLIEALRRRRDARTGTDPSR